MRPFHHQRIITILFASFVSMTSAANAQQAVLQELNSQDVKSLSSAYEFRVASFSKDEGGKGDGAHIVSLSADARTAVVNLKGKRMEMRAMHQVPQDVCQPGGQRQLVYGSDSLRLMAKLNFDPSTSSCTAQGVIAIHVDKHTYRYLVKGERMH